MQQSDFLIIGSGIAGLTFALKLAGHYPAKSVTILTKSSADESNSYYAQGGIAAVFDLHNDALRKHIEDTMIAGDGLCDKDVVEMVVSEGPDQVRELCKWGVTFDEGPMNDLHLGLEGGHTANRIVHRKDHTGATVIRTLLNRILSYPNIHLQHHIFTTDLILNKYRTTCTGVNAINTLTGEYERYYASYTMLATGGSGRVYLNTTNPPVATGDGTAMARRAGAEIKDMEFVQFHPTALYEPGSKSPFLISEAVRGAGAILRNNKGEAFMRLYDPRADLASRDIVARAIYKEMQDSGEPYVFLDCRHMDQNQFVNQFPGITRYCFERDIDPATDMIPVAPAAHFNNGGLAVDKWGQTSIGHLFAIGECACTGLHGANRLASNSLLEGLVFANQAYHRIVELSGQGMLTSKKSETPGFEDVKPIPDTDQIQSLVQDIRMLMNENAGILKNNADLRSACDAIRTVNSYIDRMFTQYKPTEAMYELRNIGINAALILEHSMARKENKGVFMNVDNRPRGHIKRIRADQTVPAGYDLYQ